MLVFVECNSMTFAVDTDEFLFGAKLAVDYNHSANGKQASVKVDEKDREGYSHSLLIIIQ